VLNGECDVAQARAKHQYMADRIRVPEAAELAEPLLKAALASLHDLEGDGQESGSAGSAS
jgi:hypothetical protein